MEAWIDRGASYRKERHRFCRAVDRSPPFLPEQKQDRRNQCASVSDADPEHEVRNVPRPTNGLVITPDTNACEYQIAEHAAEHGRNTDRNPKGDVPIAWRFAFDHCGDSFGQAVVGLLAFNQQGFRQWILFGNFEFVRYCLHSCSSVVWLAVRYFKLPIPYWCSATSPDRSCVD